MALSTLLLPFTESRLEATGRLFRYIGMRYSQKIIGLVVFYCAQLAPTNVAKLLYLTPIEERKNVSGLGGRS